MAQSAERSGRAVVVATTGSGMTDLCREAGATAVEFDRARPLTATAVDETFASLRADEVIVLPNNPRYVSLFEAAAHQLRDAGLRIAVIPTQAQVQGLAALAVHDPGRSFDDDVVTMSSAAAHTGHGAVTVATEPGITMAGPCARGDVLGVVAGDFAFIGDDLAAVGIDVLERLISPSSELVTLVSGVADEGRLAGALAEHIREHHHGIDAVVYQGGQENYPVFIAVE